MDFAALFRPTAVRLRNENKLRERARKIQNPMVPLTPMEVDTTAKITLRRSLGKALLALPACVLFAIGGYYMAVGGFGGGNASTFEVVLECVVIALFSAFRVLGPFEIVRYPMLEIEIGPYDIELDL